MILALRTDKPEAELYLFNDGQQIDRLAWHAHRELSDTVLIKIDELLNNNSLSKTDLKGIIIYQGPGSFTGLRIGISVANTLAYSLNIPIAAAAGEAWIQKSLEAVAQKNQPEVVVPEYGSDVHITQPRK